MARRYHLAPLPSPGRCELPPAVAHHVARVLRQRAGDQLCLFDGEGREAAAVICAITGSGNGLRVTIELGPSRVSPREPRIRVEVAFAAPKGNRAEWLFEHGTEVGISAFHPLTTDRATGKDRHQRWQRIVTAATGQCDRARIPELSETQSLERFLASPDLPEERYLADPDGQPLVSAQTPTALLLVGPEGGLSEAEAALTRAHGFSPRNLGVTTLRTETAVVCGAVRLLGPG